MLRMSVGAGGVEGFRVCRLLTTPKAIDWGVRTLTREPICTARLMPEPPSPDWARTPETLEPVTSVT
jgi:hypothetical protein